MLVAEIENRQFSFAPYGIAITKRVGRERGVNPIWYIDDHMGTGKSSTGEKYRKEFWWEREWRMAGDFLLPDTIICLCPEPEIEEFEELLTKMGIEGRCNVLAWAAHSQTRHSLKPLTDTDYDYARSAFLRHRVRRCAREARQLFHKKLLTS